MNSQVPRPKCSFFNLTDHQFGFLLAVVGTGLFSLKSILIKLIYIEGLSADEVLVWRMILAMPLYLGVLIWLHTHPTRSLKKLGARNFLAILGLGFLGYYLASLLDLKGLELITAQLERLVLFTYPFMVAILGFLFFKQALTKRLLISLVITYSGICLVMWQELELTGNDVLLGTLLVLGAALSFSFYVLFSKAWIHRIGSIYFTSLVMTASSLIVMLHGTLLIEFNMNDMSQTAWFWLSILAIFSTVIPSFMMTEAIARIGPAQTGVVGTLGPIFTMGLAIAWLGEPMSFWMASGALLVIFGVLMLSKKSK